jgi:hypothetical protein
MSLWISFEFSCKLVCVQVPTRWMRLARYREDARAEVIKLLVLTSRTYDTQKDTSLNMLIGY